MRARIVARTKLYYRDGADPSQDRPPHVRAASGVAYVDTPRGVRLVVAQDDVSFLALIDPSSSPAFVVDGAVALPAADGGRRQFDEASGTKKDKLDLECVVVLPPPAGPLVVAFGSGSTERRERIAIARVDRSPAVASLVDAHALYASLRAHPTLGGAELNIEGAAYLASSAANAIGAPRVRLFQRGNGAGAVDATFDVDARALLAYLDALSLGQSSASAPAILESARWTLGAVPWGASSARLTFTDAHWAHGSIYVVAAAEASPNAVDDGEIVGCAFGKLGSALSPILDENGAVYVGKPEGIAIDPLDRTRGVLVVDKDDASAAAELLAIAIEE